MSHLPDLFKARNLVAATFLEGDHDKAAAPLLDVLLDSVPSLSRREAVLFTAAGLLRNLTLARCPDEKAEAEVSTEDALRAMNAAVAAASQRWGDEFHECFKSEELGDILSGWAQFVGSIRSDGWREGASAAYLRADGDARASAARWIEALLLWLRMAPTVLMAMKNPEHSSVLKKTRGLLAWYAKDRRRGLVISDRDCANAGLLKAINVVLMEAEREGEPGPTLWFWGRDGRYHLSPPHLKDVLRRKDAGIISSSPPARSEETPDLRESIQQISSLERLEQFKSEEHERSFLQRVTADPGVSAAIEYLLRKPEWRRREGDPDRGPNPTRRRVAAEHGMSEEALRAGEARLRREGEREGLLLDL
jgi:hypothetical protein